MSSGARRGRRARDKINAETRRRGGFWGGGIRHAHAAPGRTEGTQGTGQDQHGDTEARRILGWWHQARARGAGAHGGDGGHGTRSTRRHGGAEDSGWWHQARARGAGAHGGDGGHGTRSTRRHGGAEDSGWWHQTRARGAGAHGGDGGHGTRSTRRHGGAEDSGWWPSLGVPGDDRARATIARSTASNGSGHRGSSDAGTADGVPNRAIATIAAFDPDRRCAPEPANLPPCLRASALISSRALRPLRLRLRALRPLRLRDLRPLRHRGGTSEYHRGAPAHRLRRARSAG